MLGIEHPIISAPMAQVSGGALAAGVTDAGGLHVIGGGYGDESFLARAWTDAGNARVGVGFITWRLAEEPALLDEALDHAPALVWLSFGDAARFARSVKAVGGLLALQVQTVEMARAAVSEGGATS